MCVSIHVWRCWNWTPRLLFICSASPLPEPRPQGKHHVPGPTEEAFTGSTWGLNHFHQYTDWLPLFLLLLSLLVWPIIPTTIIPSSHKTPSNFLRFALVSWRWGRMLQNVSLSPSSSFLIFKLCRHAETLRHHRADHQINRVTGNDAASHSFMVMSSVVVAGILFVHSFLGNLNQNTTKPWQLSRFYSSSTFIKLLGFDI